MPEARRPILTVNAGSSSIRLALFAAEGDGLRALSRRHAECGEETSQALLQEFLAGASARAVAAVAHRVVHGGAKLVRSCLIDAAVEAEIARVAPLAPLHNPPALEWIGICREALGTNVPQVAVFDTAFFSDLPQVARTYALPLQLAREHGLRRYGFHGIAHQAMARYWCARRPDLREGGRVISLQLGAGCSIAAVRYGRALDTSMGFSPLEGLVMATRCGDVDAGLLTYLQRERGLTGAQLEGLLNKESGLLGVSGVSADMRVLLESHDPAARLAVELYCYRARKYIGAYFAVLGGADAILFGGGVGENAPAIRERILTGMKWAGIVLDDTSNRAALATEACISGADSRAEVWVIPVDEAAILAEEAAVLVKYEGDNDG